MTDIAFHFGAPDKVAYACRLLRKAVRAGNRVLVIVDEAELNRLDADLWAVSPVDFVAHCVGNAEASIRKRSPVVLTSAVATVEEERQLMVNLSCSMPQKFEHYSKLVEVVSLAEEDRVLARQRWKKYTALGYTLMKHDLQLKGAH